MLLEATTRSRCAGAIGFPMGGGLDRVGLNEIHAWGDVAVENDSASHTFSCQLVGLLSGWFNPNGRERSI